MVHKLDDTSETKPLDPQLPGGKPVAKRFNILCGEVCQNDGFHTGLDDRFTFFRVFINRHCHPNELSIAEVSLFGKFVAFGEFLQREGNDEILLNGLENIINNGSRCDFAFVVPVVIEKAVDKQLS